MLCAKTLLILGCFASVAHALPPETHIDSTTGESTRIQFFSQKGTEVQSGKATGVVKAPFAEVMKAVQDYGHYKEFIPYCSASRVLAQRGMNAMVYLEAQVMRKTLTYWVQLKVFARRAKGSTVVIEARRINGNINRATARWELTPLVDGTTRVSFELFVDPDLPIPDAIVTTQNGRTARKTISALRQRIRIKRATS